MFTGQSQRPAQLRPDFGDEECYCKSEGVQNSTDKLTDWASQWFRSARRRLQQWTLVNYKSAARFNKLTEPTAEEQLCKETRWSQSQRNVGEKLNGASIGKAGSLSDYSTISPRTHEARPPWNRGSDGGIATEAKRSDEQKKSKKW